MHIGLPLLLVNAPPLPSVPPDWTQGDWRSVRLPVLVLDSHLDGDQCARSCVLVRMYAARVEGPNLTVAEFRALDEPAASR